MPLYEYVCKDCDVLLTMQQSLADNTLPACIECGKKMRKKFGAVPASFKGEGFYTTDKFSDR